MHAYVGNPCVPGADGNRFEFCLAGLREGLWEFADGTLNDPIEEEQHNKPIWHGTPAMRVDPTTKHGHERVTTRLVLAMQAGLLYFTA